MSLDASLRAALNARVLTTPGFPSAVDYENTKPAGTREPFQPPANAPWARITHRFGLERLRTLPAPGGRVEKTGFLQVDCFVPLLSGTSALDTLAQAVRDTLPPNLFLSVEGFRLTVQWSQRYGGQRDAGWFWDHVDIGWTLWTTNPLGG